MKNKQISKNIFKTSYRNKVQESGPFEHAGLKNFQSIIVLEVFY
jgi:hypothetical protein